MTREQDLERQLAEWLDVGPSTAPAEIVEQALEQTAGRHQSRGAWRLLVLPLARLGRWSLTYRTARVSALAAVLAGILLTSVIVYVPFTGGGPGPSPSPEPAPKLGPAPLMDSAATLVVSGMAGVDIKSETPAMQVRSMDLETDDPRIDGRAIQELAVLVEAGGIRQLHGSMRLQNDWGTWEGPVDIVRYPSGEEYEYASLTGSGAYAGFTYLYTVRQATAEAERAVEGAIWPGEPPPLLDPSLLP
jgi:hypothetical protein